MKPNSPLKTPDRDAQLLARIDELRRELKRADPQTLANLAGCEFLPEQDGAGEFRLALWGREVRLRTPDWSAAYMQGGEVPHTANLALLIYYFHTIWTVGDQAPSESTRWISFSDLPDGRFYAQAFQGYSGALLARRFGNRREAFEAAAQSCGGAPIKLGDAAFAFEVLPRVSLAAVCWLGDEDFPASYRVLFSEAVAGCLPTDACAIAGSMITRRLVSYP